MSTNAMVVSVLLAAAALAAPGRAAAAAGEQRPLVYAIVIGNNDGLGMLPQLHFADDDALRFYDLATRLTEKRNVALLTELDVDTWRRIQLGGNGPPPYLSPTRQKLLEVIELFKQQIARARQREPRRPVHFFFFFSGHGERGYFFLKKKSAELADSAFTGTDLDRTFADSRATLNALFIDACKSQSLFLAKGPRGDDELGPDFSSLIAGLERTSTRTPIGVLTSTVSDKPAGEARDIRGGYFSHVLISGLRGAADANSDGLVRYGELAAFVSFHTRRIAGQRPWFRPPQGRLDAPLVALKHRRDLLEIPPGIGGHFAIFDEGGRNLVLETHKTEAQWTRLILSPARYKVVWVASATQGRAATADLTRGPQRLMLKDFQSAVALGQAQVPKGEGLGAPPEEGPPADAAVAAFDPTSSGFDQPFTPRVVSAMTVAYTSGLTATAIAPPESEAAGRHLLSLGYGYASPPVEPFSAGQAVSLSYRYLRPWRWPITLGGSALVTFSEHDSPTSKLPYRMRQVILQAEGAYTFRPWRRLEIFAGGYLGWQMALITRDVLVREGEKERQGTALSGDPAGFRAGLLGGLRFNIYAGLWLSATASWGLDLIHQEEDDGDSRAVLFLRPHFLGQVGYAF